MRPYNRWKDEESILVLTCCVLLMCFTMILASPIMLLECIANKLGVDR